MESGFDPMLDQIRYLVENGLTSLVVLHDFLSKRLTPLQDRPHPTWMYTGVNNIMRLDHGSGSSLDEDLLALSLKVLTTDQISVELMVSPTVCEPLCVNQVVRTGLLAAMPMLDDVDIALVHRGDLSHVVVIPGAGGLSGSAEGRGWGGGPAGDRRGISAGPASGGPAGGRGGDPVGSRGGSPVGR
jgi:hypothetical protein